MMSLMQISDEIDYRILSFSIRILYVIYIIIFMAYAQESLFFCI